MEPGILLQPSVWASGPRHGRELIDTPDCHYSDEEFALILKRASELQDQADGGIARLPDQSGDASTAEGLSLEAVRDIAQEVGLDPRFIDQAAASLAHDPDVREPSLLGGPLTHHLGDTFARTLTDAERNELLDVIRGVLKHQGATHEVLGSLEWKTVGRIDQLTVTITASDERVAVRVLSDVSGLAALTWVGSIVPTRSLSLSIQLQSITITCTTTDPSISRSRRRLLAASPSKKQYPVGAATR